MSQWVTVKQFILPQDAYIAQGKLESEGIRTFLKDELTVQTDNFLSNAVGGVKLQVLEPDFEKAHEILLEGGFIHESKPYRSKFLQFIDVFTAKLPLIGKSILELRILVFAAIFMVLLFSILAFFYWPSTTDKLSKNAWCIEQLLVDGQEHYLKYNGLVVDYLNSCDDFIIFETEGNVLLSIGMKGQWYVQKDSLFLKDFNHGESILNGDYAIQFDRQYVYLKSENVGLIGSIMQDSYNSYFPF